MAMAQAIVAVSMMPADVMVSGLESDGVDRFYCGGGASGKIRVVQRPD